MAKMMTPARYVLLALSIVISLHYILSFSHDSNGRATSISNFIGNFWSKNNFHSKHDDFDTLYGNSTRKANATYVILARNSDLDSLIGSLKHIEDHFNKEYQYPYVFLNDEPFSDEFKERTSIAISTKAEYGLIEHDHWFQPGWIDEERAAASREEMVKDNVDYAGSVAYRNMCRFNSGFFFRHPLLQKYRYYWRIEPGVTFFCDLHYDPFLVMQDEKKVYGFTMSLYEYSKTIPTLWDTTKKFIKQYPELLAEDNSMSFLSDDGGENYNLCHFWSNFEIGDLDFWRGEAYMKYFKFLDETGGFYYERWGDAPVHSIGAALFARKDQIHFFREIGYRHDPFQHCPQGEAHRKGKCQCEEKENFDYDGYSCTYRYDRMFNSWFL